jgi:hypothetical protein
MLLYLNWKKIRYHTTLTPFYQQAVNRITKTYKQIQAKIEYERKQAEYRNAIYKGYGLKR